MPKTAFEPTVSPSQSPMAGMRCVLSVPEFSPAALIPQDLHSWSAPEQTDTSAIVRAYENYGFALVEGPQPPSEDDLRSLATGLQLGDVFTPPIYAGQAHTAGSGITRLSSPPIASLSAAGAHPVFQDTGAQDWHTDGTLQPIGHVATSILLCRRPAANGGQSLMFNATGAFMDLIDLDPQAARTLMYPQVLLRTSNLPGITSQTHAGPAFTFNGPHLLTRYSVTSTEHYDHTAVADPQALQRGLDFLQAAAQPGSRHYLEFSLAENQGLIFANDRLSHGRRAWSDDPREPRDMLRALFTRRPACATEYPATQAGRA